MKLKKSLLVFLCGLMGCVDAGNGFTKPVSGTKSLRVYDASGDSDGVIDPDSDVDDSVARPVVGGFGELLDPDGLGDMATDDDAPFDRLFARMGLRVVAGEEVAGRGEGVAVAADEDSASAYEASPVLLSGEQRDQLVAVFGEDLTARYLEVTAETRDAVREEIILYSSEKNPDAYKDDLQLAQLEMSLDLFVALNSGKGLDEALAHRMLSQAQAMQDKMNEVVGVGAGASPIEAMRAGMHKTLVAEGSTDFDQSIARLMLARLDRFENENRGLQYQNPLALCGSDRSGRSYSMGGLQDLLDASDDSSAYADFFKALGCASMSIGMAYQRGESLPADAVLFLMGVSGLMAPRLSLVPIHAWTSEYLHSIARAARSEDLSAGALRYSAAQNVLEAGQALLRAGDSFTTVSTKTLRLYDAIEKYLALRGSSSALVSARR